MARLISEMSEVRILPVAPDKFLLMLAIRNNKVERRKGVPWRGSKLTR